MKKRILALVLSVAMVLSFLPFSAFASTETSYASELSDSAHYLMKLPEEDSLSKTYQWNSNDGIIPIREEGGERFLVFNEENFSRFANQDTFNVYLDGISKLTYGNDYGIPSSVPFGTDEAGEEDASKTWIAVRVKINDNTEAYGKTMSAFRLLASFGSETNTEGYRHYLFNKKANSPAKWLDLNDGSMTLFYADSGVYRHVSTANNGAGNLEFTGDMDGYIMIPVDKTETTLDALRNNFKGFRLLISEGTSIGGVQTKESSWDDKELLIGDSFIVTDPEAFQSDIIAAKGITKYALNGGADTAYQAIRIGGYRSRYYAVGSGDVSTVGYGGLFGKDQYDPDVQDTDNALATVHVTTLSNGDRALEISPNTTTTVDETTGESTTSYLNYHGEKYYLGMPIWDTYDHLREHVESDAYSGTSAFYRAQANKGVATELTGKFDGEGDDDFTYIAYRIAIKGTDMTAKSPHHLIKIALSSGSVEYFTTSTSTKYKFVDVKTGEISDLSCSSWGVKFKGDVDGYILIPLTDYDSLSGIATNFGGTSWVGSYTNSTTRIRLIHQDTTSTYSWKDGAKLYFGGAAWVEDIDTFTAYHSDCAQSGHVYEETARTEPDCDDAGSITYTCTRTACGDTYTEEIPALGHTAGTEATPAGDHKTHTYECTVCGGIAKTANCSYTVDKEQSTEPTCTSGGIQVSVCSKCGDVKEFPLDPKGHNIEDVKATPVENNKGYHEYLCTVCGVGQNVAECDYVEISRTPATFDAPGEIVYECSACGDTKTEPIEQLECNHAETKIEGYLAPDCDSVGATGKEVCTKCGATVKESEEIPATGHDYDEVVTKPTCTEGGYTTYTCTVCGDSYTADETEATGHTAPVGGKAKEYCANGCGTVIYDLEAELNKGGEYTLPYSMTTDEAIEITAKVTLNLNGKTISSTEYDKEGNGIFRVLAGGELTINGEGTLNAAANGTGYAMAIWADGGKVIINDGTYTNVGAGEDDQYDLIYVKNGGIVEINGGEFISETPRWTLNSHNTNVGTFVVKGGKFYQYDPSNINTDEAEGVQWVAEGYDVKADGEYFVVGAHQHDYVPEVTEPTCEEGGYTTYTCACGDSYVDENSYTDPTDHAWEAAKGEDAKCGVDGYVEYYCKNGCGETYTETIPALEHDMDEGAYTAPTFEKDGYTTYTCKRGCGYSYDVIDEGTQLKAAAQIKDGAKFETFAEAYAAAQAGDTIVLLADLDASSIIVIDKAITLDGNNKTLTSTAGRAINVSGANGVTIKNLTIVAKGERAINVIQGATNVTIDNVTATAANYTVNVASSAANAVVEIKNSVLTGLNVVNVGAAGAVVTVEGTTINCEDKNANENYGALCLNKDAVNGKITATDVTINLKDDSVNGKNGAVGGIVTIDGSVEGIEIDVCFIQNSENYYYGYTSLAEAVANAKAGDTIILLRDITLTEMVKIAKEITIDLNGNNIVADVEGTYGALYVALAGNLTITGEGSVSNAAGYAIGNYGVLTVENGTISGVDASIYNFYYNASSYGKATINGGKVEGQIWNSGELTVNGGEVAYIDNSGKLVVTGGAVAQIFGKDGADAPEVEGCGTIAIEDTSIIEIAEYYVLDEIADGVYKVNYHTCDYDEVVTAPTCTEGGYTTYTCTVCGDSYTADETEATGHTAPVGGKAKEYCANGCGTVIYDLEAELNKGGEYTLPYSMTTDGPIEITANVVLNLNGKTIEATENDTIGDGVFHVLAGGELTINGEGTIEAVGGSEYAMAIWADGGKVIINGGTYTNVGAGEYDQYDLIYVKNGGSIEINGGEFISETPRWTLNSHNTNVGTFVVKGGKFYQYDPSNINTDEAEGVQWVAEGYDVVADGEYFEVVLHEHDYDAVVTEPTCTEGGYTTYTCACGDTYTADETDALGHDYDAVVTAPDCVNGGFTTYTCTVCGDSYVADEVAALGHNYNAGVYTAPTLEKDGFTTYTCTVCGDSYVVFDEDSKLPATGPAVTFVGATEGTITVSWEAIEGAKTVFVRAAGDKTVHTSVSGDKTTATITGLTPGTDYEVSICVEYAGYQWTEYGVATTATTTAVNNELIAEETADGIKLIYKNVKHAGTVWFYSVDANGNTKLIKNVAGTVGQDEVEIVLSYLTYGKGTYTFTAIGAIDIDGKVNYVQTENVTAEGRNPVAVTARVDGSNVVLNISAPAGSYFWVKQVVGGKVTQLAATSATELTKAYVEGAEYYVIASHAGKYITSDRVTAE